MTRKDWYGSWWGLMWMLGTWAILTTLAYLVFFLICSRLGVPL